MTTKQQYRHEMSNKHRWDKPMDCSGWCRMACLNLFRGLWSKKPLLLLLLLLCTTVKADDSLLLQGGWSHTSSSAYGDAGTAVVRYEHGVLDSLAVGAEYGYHGAQSHYTDDAQGDRFTYGSISGHSVMGDLIYRLPEMKKLKPYILGGLGVSIWDFDLTQESKDAGYEVRLGNSLAYKAEVGVDYAINERWSLNLAWSYFKTDVPKESTPHQLLGDDDRSGRVRIGQEELSLVAGIKYKF